MATEAIASSSITYVKEPPGRAVKPAPVNMTKPIAAVKPGVKPGVIVAIPAYNEEVAIGSVVLRSLKHADLVLVIDDGSKDNTAEVARLAGAEVIKHEKNQGKGAGIRDAFDYAKKMNAEVLIVIDGDGQHNPDEIPALLAPLLKGEADMVNGSRFLVKNGNHVPKYRRVGQEVLTMATNAGSQVRITDSQNGFRAFSRKTFDCFSLQQNGMAIESEMLMDATQADIKIIEVPIDVRYDVKGSTFNPVTHGVGVLGKVISLISQRRPLLFFCAPGAALLILGVIFAVLSFNTFNATRNISIIYTAGCGVFILVGVFSIFTGLILGAIQSIKINGNS